MWSSFFEKLIRENNNKLHHLETILLFPQCVLIALNQILKKQFFSIYAFLQNKLKNIIYLETHQLYYFREKMYFFIYFILRYKA